jgi:hypothetical protein
VSGPVGVGVADKTVELPKELAAATVRLKDGIAGACVVANADPDVDVAVTLGVVILSLVLASITLLVSLDRETSINVEFETDGPVLDLDVFELKLELLKKLEVDSEAKS